MAAVVTDTRLFVRSKPGTATDSKVLGWYLYPQQRAEVLEGPVLASGYPWYRVQVNEDEGWVASRSRSGEPWLALATPYQTVVSGSNSGESTTCALTSEGGVKCWGANWSGQLGNGSASIRGLTPVGVVGLSGGVAAIAVGYAHACAATGSGAAFCWGRNDRGQLGNGTTTDSSTPVEVTGLVDAVRAVAAAEQHTCALTVAGGVACWGSNRNGQLGDGTTTDSSIPVAVAGLQGGIVAIAAGRGHTCALTGAGGVKCWGRNDQGQLGDGTTTERHRPVDVIGLASGGATIAAGDRHNCALTRSGRVLCWGRMYRNTPVAIVGLDLKTTAVSAGAVHDCALSRVGQVRCWGGNAYGQLGDGTTRYRRTPTPVANLPRGVIAVSASNFRTCAVTNTGGIKCWGLYTGAAEGPAVLTRSRLPVDVDESIHQTITLRPSTTASHPEGPITFTASVSPLGRRGVETTVRFVVRQRVEVIVKGHSYGRWATVAQRDVRADRSGLAILDWTFDDGGSWNVIAWAPANRSYTASMWSPSWHFYTD